MPNILDQNIRKNIIEEIKGDENRKRKHESLERFEIYRNRTTDILMNELNKEFAPETIREMRVVDSINFCRRVIQEQASLYNREPIRRYEGLDEGDELNESLKALYRWGDINTTQKTSNRLFKLHNQMLTQVVPVNGRIRFRNLQPHNVDVVPNSNDPEILEAFIVNTVDPRDLLKRGDSRNQKIADEDDWEPANMRFVWWDGEVNFTTDGNGTILTEIFEHGLGIVPAVDISLPEKNFRFWCRTDSNAARFTKQALLALSDAATTNKLQAWAQAVLISEDPTEKIHTGPDRLIRLKVDSTTQIPPRFEFVSPSPDLGASIDLIDLMINLWLTSEGLDPKIISGKSEATRYTSGVERLIATLDRLEASREDMETFKQSERELFDLIVQWNNKFQNTDLIAPDHKFGLIPEDLELEIQFQKPDMVETTEDKEASIQRRLELGVISKIEAIAELRGVSDEKARDILDQINSEDGITFGTQENSGQIQTQ